MNLQNKVFEKKVSLDTGYCMTLDRVPEESYPEIARCDEHFDELERLYVICEIPANLNNAGQERSTEWLKVRNDK